LSTAPFAFDEILRLGHLRWRRFCGPRRAELGEETGHEVKKAIRRKGRHSTFARCDRHWFFAMVYAALH
jgi:hypothetical protein